MVELPYMCDSHEYYLRDSYAFDDPALELASDEDEVQEEEEEEEEEDGACQWRKSV